MEENNKELIIDENTNLRKIKNKEDYTKLILGIEVSNRFLSSFSNIKDLSINSHIPVTNNYNETHLNKMSFMTNLEKISFKNIWGLGKLVDGKKTKDYILNAPNLKTVELPSSLLYINKQYLDCCHNLEKIILNIPKNPINKKLFVNNTNLKEIEIKHNGDIYEVIPDYKIYSITRYGYFENDRSCYLYFRNNNYVTYIHIKDKKMDIENRLVNINNDLVNDGCLFIPDFVNTIKREDFINFLEKNLVKEISLNTKILKTSDGEILLQSNKNLEKIILRSNNDMKLFGSKEFDIKEYGKVEKVFISKNKLCISYNDFIITIDEQGNLIKKEKEQRNKIRVIKYSDEELIDCLVYKRLLEIMKENAEKNNKFFVDNVKHELSKCTKEEVINYLCYKKFLEIIKDIKFDNNNKDVIDIITEKFEKKLIKK